MIGKKIKSYKRRSIRVRSRGINEHIDIEDYTEHLLAYI